MASIVETVCEAIRAIADAASPDARERCINEAVEIATDNIERLESEVGDLEEKVEAGEAEDTSHADAIHAFLDEVERPVGTMIYNVPANDRVNRAIIGLHDAIGRNI